MTTPATTTPATTTTTTTEPPISPSPTPALSPRPLQIIATGDGDEDNLFLLNEENLQLVIDKIPPHMKVAIVAVVGAFRTGKSFLLSLFLRYLRSGSTSDPSTAWMTREGEELLEGNLNEGGWAMVDSGKEGSPEVNPLPLLREKSFSWRGGQKRMTTGLWLWSEPFIRKTRATGGEEIAVLLMDTQGMFDNQTTMTLTAQIFGLSTLVSSFEIYNVDKRIQEDNLQHLALFSEYGRMALLPQAEQAKQLEALEKKNPLTEALAKGENQGETEENTSSPPPAPTPAEETAANPATHKKPFQRLQFLVRDWQNFEEEFGEEDGEEKFKAVLGEMGRYLDEVLKPRNASDLQSTREQITRCFEKLDCYLLPHPGFEVTKKSYDGSIARISPDFKVLLNRYVRLVFEEELQAKEINGRLITGLELRNFFKVYVRMFQGEGAEGEGGRGGRPFPKAMTMLEATAEANNRSAFDLSLRSYREGMEALVGQGKAFVSEIALTESHLRLHHTALQTFDDIATMGSEANIATVRKTLTEELEGEKKRFFQTNALRNPYRDMEYYVLPLAVALVAYFLAKITDKTCSTDFCERLEDTFQNLYSFVFFMLLVICWRQIRSVLSYLKDLLLPILASHGVNIDLQALANKKND